MLQKHFKNLSGMQLIAIGFFLLIMTGTFLLMLPVSSRDGTFTPFMTALFTATSASCVTGLILVDTYTHWSLFGQLVLLALIQIGGLGFITIGTAVSLILRRKIGLKERGWIKESFNVLDIGGVVRLIRLVLKGTLLFEGVGALLLFIRFYPRMGFAKGLYYGIWHAISAFCNAGFDLMGGHWGQFSSFSAYVDDPLVILTLCGLILTGGAGFLVWDDLARNKLRWRHYRLQTKVVLAMNLLLVVGGGALFFLFERNNLGAGRPLREQVLGALFDAVTPRTAGFNSTDTGALTSGSLLLTIIFMFIGGSPGSTAGGVKTTTVFVILLHALSGVRRERSANAFGRSIGDDTLKKATAVLYTNLLLALVGAVAICAIQPFGLTEVLFETFSAIGTAGMTMGITRDLLPLSRLIIIFLMYCGRVGSISFAVALLEKRALPPVTLPREDITIG